MPESNSNIDPRTLWSDLYKKSEYCLDQDEVIQSLFLATPGASPFSLSSLLASALSHGAPPRSDIVVVTNKAIKILDQAALPFSKPNTMLGGKIIETLPRNIKLSPTKKSFAFFYKCVLGGKDYWVPRGYVRSMEIADSFLSES